MLKRTRVSPATDTARVAAAMSRPGIDPRIWISLGIVRAFSFDATHGPFADVILLPSQLKVTARISAIYAGGGFGVYAPLRVDDEVVILVPGGAPEEGAVIVGRLWSAADAPPADAVSNLADLVIVVQGGQNVRVDVSGGGTVKFNGDSDAMALASLVKQRVDTLQQKMDTHVHPVPGVATGGATVTSLVQTVPLGPQAGVASTVVKAGA